MKRFTVVTGILGLSILALWAVFQISSASPTKAKANIEGLDAHNTASEVSKANLSGEMAVPVTGVDVRVAPVYDANGILLSDPSGTISNAISSEPMVAPVFDATGAVVSDPTGTILNASNP
jgi:hypothetical protein